MEKWSVKEVCEFLRRNDFEEDIIEMFRVNKIKGRVLPLLSDDDMEKLGLSVLGDRKYFQHILHKVQEKRSSEVVTDKKKVLQSICTEDGEDLGIIILFSDSNSIHTCMGRPSMATVTGTWGSSRISLMAPQAGGNPAQSKTNLMIWFDAVVTRLTAEDLLVYDAVGGREWGLYHHMFGDEFINLTSVLSSSLSVWGNDCQAAGFSCGKVYYLSGNGRGKVTIAHQYLGPFVS